MSGPASFKRGAVLAALNIAFRAACRGGLTASVDRCCAQRSSKFRPGRRNGRSAEQRNGMTAPGR
jgi:hypothetical protein